MIYETPSEFSIFIEEIAIEKGITQLESIIEYCEDNSIDPLDIVHLVNSTLKSKLERNFQDNGMLPKESTLEDFYV